MTAPGLPFHLDAAEVDARSEAAQLQGNLEGAVDGDRRLARELVLPFEVEELAAGQSRLIQIARFRPKGLLGLAYWFAVLPLHGFVFRGMLEGIRRSAEQAGSGRRELMST